MSAVAPVRFAVRCDEKLLEVPRYIVPAYGGPQDFTGAGHEWGGVVTREGQTLPQEFEDGVGVFSVHF